MGVRRWIRVGVVALALLLAPGLAAQPMVERPEVRVIVDVSGSMRHNDPEQLSATALELLAALLPAGTPAGVWTFGESVEQPLPLGEVTPAWREAARALRPRLVAYQPFTDIEAAVREAAAPAANGWRHLVLLTDGVIDLPPVRGAKPTVDEASRRALLETLAPRLAEEGVVVHAIAFSAEADLALVQRLARTTGGLSALVESPESLLVAFLDIYDRIFPADRIALAAGRFAIEPGVQGFTALLLHEPGGEPLALEAPDGRRYTAESPPAGASWQVEPRFDLIRVPDPLPGDWRLLGSMGDGSRVSVDARLGLATAPLPATLYQGFPQPLAAWLERDGVPYAAPLAGLTLSAELHDGQGQVQAAIRLAPQGERFVGELPAPALAGPARLSIQARAEGLERHRQQAVSVLPAIDAWHEPAEERVVLEALHPALDHQSAEPWGELGGERLTAQAVDARRWHLPLPALEAGLTRPLLLWAHITLEGESRELALPRLLLFPDAEVGLGVATLDAAAPGAERFHEDLVAGREGPALEPSAADRLVAAIRGLSEDAARLWREGLPGLRERLPALTAEPWAWALATLALGGVTAAWWLAHRRRRRPLHREEPHV